MGSDTGALTRTGSGLPASASGHIPPPQNQEAEQFLLASLIDVGGNKVAVTSTDIEASNGVIHVIDGVLLPTS